MNHLIKQWRQEAGMTQGELAQKVYVTPQYISLIEKEKRSVTHEFLLKVADALDKEFIYFVRDKNVVKKIDKHAFDHDVNRLIRVPGLINLDEHDFLKVIEDNDNECYFSKASGNNVKEVMELVCNNLQTKKRIEDVKACLFVVEGGASYFHFDDLDDASECIYKLLGRDIPIIVGATITDAPQGYTVHVAL